MIIALMQSTSTLPATNPWLIRLLTLALSALAAGSCLFWVLTWPAPTAPLLAALGTSAVQGTPVNSELVAQLLGAPTTDSSNVATGPAPSSYVLVGVIAQGGRGSQGSALIGKAGEEFPQPYLVGDTVVDGLVLHAVHARSAVLGPAGNATGTLTLELPVLPSAQ